MERLRKRAKVEKTQQPPDEYDDLDCPVCQKRYSREDTLLSHVKDVHWETTTCDVCSKVLSSYQALLRHFMTHTDIRPFSCTLCPKTFKRVDTLRYHERSVHRQERDEPEEGNDIFIARQCRICLEDYPSIQSIHHHLVCCMRSGKPRMDHQCLVCLKSSSCCFKINKHLEEHNFDEIPRSKAFQCGVCFRLLASQKTLNQHRCETIPKDLEFTTNPCIPSRYNPFVSYLPQVVEEKEK